MKHKVNCSLCGEKETLLIDKDTGKIKSKWAYFGKFNINADKTTKYSYKPKNPDKPIDFDKLIRVPNPKYNPEIKLKYMEEWECPRCYSSPKTKEVNQNA